VTSSAPLRREIERRFPQRPFVIELWDGTAVPATAAGPTLRVRSPRGVAYVLHAPGQLGLGRAYVAGEIEVDDLDALVDVADAWRPPALSAWGRVRLLLAAARAAGGLSRPPVPVTELRPRGAPTPGAATTGRSGITTMSPIGSLRCSSTGP
jgi:cyclopropane-fatty-acyl-phospholipid synthase